MSAMSNARWLTLAQAARIVLQLVSLVILARLLPPSEYGLLAMATVAMNFAYLLRAVQGPAAFWLLGVGLQVAFLSVALYLVGRMGLRRILRGDDDASGNP